tara:strand:+ start:399 stop:530 length:132 start_codon:yes stop_codon:yes gene_type:complete
VAEETLEILGRQALQTLVVVAELVDIQLVQQMRMPVAMAEVVA